MRPGGYGESSLLERNPLYPKYKSNKHYLVPFFDLLAFFYNWAFAINFFNIPLYLIYLVCKQIILFLNLV